MPEFVVQIGQGMVKVTASRARVAVNHALLHNQDFGVHINGGQDRQLRKGETLVVSVRNLEDCPEWGNNGN